MNNDDERDYAEERANLADMRREQEGEAAHERLVERVVTELRALGTAAYLDARSSITRLIEEVDLRLPVNAHRYELLARAQHTATLAIEVANGLGLVAGYDLAGAARQIGANYARRHSGEPGDLFGRAAAGAVERVTHAVDEYLAAEEQREQDARDAADHAETEAYLLRVTR
jgi:hypothetical protein